MQIWVETERKQQISTLFALSLHSKEIVLSSAVIGYCTKGGATIRVGADMHPPLFFQILMFL